MEASIKATIDDLNQYLQGNVTAMGLIITLEDMIEFIKDSENIYENKTMENLNEGKKKKSSYMTELAEIDKQSALVALEAKINKLAEMAEAKTNRLSMVNEDENLSELISKQAVKEMQKSIKEIEKLKEKLLKEFTKKGGKMTEVIDETEVVAEEEVEEGYSTNYEEDDQNSSMEEELDEAHCTSEEDDTDSMNEEYLRMQKLAGVISEEEYKKRLNENKTRNKIKNTVLESIFDKVAAAVKGKSDKEKATIEAMKKFGIEVGKPIYQFAYLPGASIEDKALQYFGSLTPEQKEKVNVPIPNGYDGKLEIDGLKKVVFQSIEEGEDGTVNITMIVGDYNFKTGKFVDEDGPSTFSMDSPDEIEKDLGGEKDANEKIYTQGLKFVPYNGSLWQEFVDRKAEFMKDTKISPFK